MVEKYETDHHNCRCYYCKYNQCLLVGNIYFKQSSACCIMEKVKKYKRKLLIKCGYKFWFLCQNQNQYWFIVGNLYKEQHKLCIAFSRHNCNWFNLVKLPGPFMVYIKHCMFQVILYFIITAACGGFKWQKCTGSKWCVVGDFTAEHHTYWYH